MSAFYNRRELLQRATAAASLAMAAQAAPPKKMRLGVITYISSNPEAVIKHVHDLGFPTCQLGIGALDDATVSRLKDALAKYNVEVTSAVATGPPPEVYDFYKGPLTIGLVPRQYRDARIARIKQVSDFAKKAGIPGVQTHCGFIPENPNEPLYTEAVNAIRTVAQYCKDNGQTFRCETGQETPITLVRAIKDVGLDNVGVNFDVGNLILYGKANPVDAVELLGPYVMGIHAKDGLYPTNPKQLGREVAIGQGKVNFPELIERLKKAGYQNPLTIEREIEGAKQTEDILAAKAYLEKLIG
ncbi:MAG TPA: sugar phosphate isomerase/epimerase family protein [Bryobacteraceae bacterium]|nr:sugar phosphate isomerase/epimerase family protein [Bryobacteraceae bacterium]